MEYPSSMTDSMNDVLLDGFQMDENPIFATNGTEDSKNRKEIGGKNPSYDSKDSVIEHVKYIELPSKKITEIRIFFDNGTYETFHPEK